jgi:flagellar biogenesis protein FliO
MSAKTMAAQLPQFAGGSPLAQHLQKAVRWLLKKFVSSAGATERALAVEERVTIGPKKSLLVVRCHGQRFLVATAGDTVGPLVEIASPKAARRSRKEREA